MKFSTFWKWIWAMF